MSIKEPSTFYDSVKPLVYFNRIVGIVPFHRQSDPNGTAYCYMQLYTIIIILTNWTTTYIGLIVLSNPAEYQDATAAARTMYQILVRANSFVAFISPVLVWRQQKGLQDSVRQMPILDDIFQAVLGAQNEYKKQYISLIYRIVGISLVTSFLGLCDAPWIMSRERPRLDTYATSVALHYPIIVMLLLDLNFCSFAGYLKKKFRQMNTCLLRLTETPSPSYACKKIFLRPRKVSDMTPSSRLTDMNAGSFMNGDHYLLHEIRKAHLELCKLFRKINLAFGIQNLLSLGISFIMVTGMLYTIYSAAKLENFTPETIIHIIPSATWTIMYGSKIWAINHSCWTVSREAKKTEYLIYELLESRIDKKLHQEVREFGVQMLQNRVRFNACGFFTLDYSFVQGVIGSITTYLVLGIQMSHLSYRSTSNKAPTSNGTEISGYSQI